MHALDQAIPFHVFLELDRREDGTVLLPLGEHVRGVVAPLHGGVLCTLLDIACGTAIHENVHYDQATAIPVSTRLDVEFLGQPRSGPLAATASITSESGPDLEVEAQVTDGGGYVIGRAIGTYRLISGFGTLGD